MQIKVDIKGMDELVGKLNKMNQMMSVRVEEQVNETGKAIRKSAKARVPVDPVDGGDLKKTISMKRSKDKLSATIGPQKGEWWKGIFIEFGTVNQPAQPFMHPAWEENKNDYLNGMKKALGKVVDES